MYREFIKWNNYHLLLKFDHPARLEIIGSVGKEKFLALIKFGKFSRCLNIKVLIIRVYNLLIKVINLIWSFMDCKLIYPINIYEN